MNICFPARNKNGKNYDSVDEMISLIRREPHGTWLAGTNMLWHGGIHLSEVSAPGSVLTGRADAAVPLQCMADGEVVAWRLNRDYLTSEYNKQTLQYSSTFMLVKSLCKPDPDKENSWLEFYSLYIGLAPLCDFPALTAYQVTEKGNRIRTRHYTGQENSGQAAPGVTGQSLKKGTQVVILRQESFQLKGKSEPFGLAQRLKAGRAHGDKFWVSLREEYLNAQEEQYGNLPDWMHHAVAQGTFNAVVKPAQKLTVAAGDAIGFLAKDIDPLGKGLVDSSYFAHIEVLCTDSRMPGFLNNPGGVTGGRDSIRIASGKTLYSRRDEGEKSTFTAMSCVVVRDSGKILPVDECHPYKDSEGKTWYKISPNCWMSEDDVDRLHQYDLKERGFTALEEGATPDMSTSLREGWMTSAFGNLSEQVNPDRGIRQQQVSEYYKKALKNIDTDGNGRLSGEELFRAMHHPEMGVQDIVARMVVKHDSEWFGDSCQTKWAPYFKNYDRLRLGYAMKWRDDMEWMSRVAPFSDGSPVWHMHPIIFLDAIAPKGGLITLAMLRKIWVDNSYASDDTLQQVATELNANLDLCHLNSEFRLYHFMAQVRQEAGANFSISENLNYASSALPVFFSYYRRNPAEQELDGRTSSHEANQENIANKAYGGRNGNNMPGDGWRYRGRGMKQLTGRSNYKKFTEYHALKWSGNIDFVNKPELLADDIKYAVRSALAFWDENEIYIQADKGYSLDVSLAVTNIVNSGLSLDEKKLRYGNLEDFLARKIFQGVY